MEVYSVVNTFNALLMGANIVVFFGFFLEYKLRKNKVIGILVSVLFVLMIVLINIFVTEPLDAYEYTSAACLMLYFLPYVLFRPVKKKTFFFAGAALNALIDYFQYIFEAFLDKSEKSIIISSVVYCVIYLALIISFVVLKKLVKIRIPSGFFDELPIMLYLAFFFVEFSAFYSGELSKDGFENIKFLSLILNIISAGLVCFSLIYMIYRYTKSTLQKKEAEMQLNMELKLYEKTIQNNQDLRRFRHDYKNNIFSLSTFINNQKYEEAKEYLNDLAGALDSTKSKFSTGNYLADAILADKNEFAEKSGSSINFFGTIPTNGIKNSDLCTILSNSLDNAIRACESIDNAIITVDGKEKKQGVAIEISNPVKSKVEIKNNEIKTTKSDKINHGIGISNIKRVAEKYNGNVTLSCDDETFSIKIGLIL